MKTYYKPEYKDLAPFDRIEIKLNEEWVELPYQEYSTFRNKSEELPILFKGLFEISQDFIRVKYLNEEDILELGWKKDKYQGSYFINDFFLELKENNKLVIGKGDMRMSDPHYELTFTCKSYNELKKLMQFLGI